MVFPKNILNLYARLIGTPNVKESCAIHSMLMYSYQMERQGGNRMDSAELGAYVNTRSIKSFEYEPHGKRISFISDWKGLTLGLGI